MYLYRNIFLWQKQKARLLQLRRLSEKEKREYIKRVMAQKLKNLRNTKVKDVNYLTEPLWLDEIHTLQ